MKPTLWTTTTTTLLALTTGGCLGRGPASDAGPKLQISVAPLSLPGIREAVYDLAIATADGQTVATVTDLSSTRYGDGRGALSYVAPCVDQPGANPHRVTLTLTHLYDETRELASPADFVNPTPVVNAEVVCRENADVPVVFDLTIMRAADQGFFDVAVNFEDIFCSAKVDCQPTLLHDDRGVRGPTAVFGFACTSGTGATGPEPTYMYVSEVSVRCAWSDGTSQTYTVPLAPVGQGDAVPADGAIYATSIFRGQEGFQDIDKCYVNTAIGLDLAKLTRDGETAVCTLTADATAASDRWTPPTTPAGHVYPVVHVEVPLTTADGALCDPNPLNGSGSGVVTDYTVADDGTIAPVPFEWVFGCGDAETRCAGAMPGVTDEVHIAAAGGALTVSVGAASATYALPDGATYANTCCASGCCAP